MFPRFPNPAADRSASRTARRLPAWALATAAGLSILTAPAAAQPRPGEPNPKYLERRKSNDLTLRTTINVRAWQERPLERQPAKREQGPQYDTWNFQTAAFVFPILEHTASSDLRETEIDGVLTLEDREVDNSVTIITNFPVGAKYGRWDIVPPEGKEVVAREVELRVEMPIRVFETVFHDDAAARVAWPTGAWPPEAASAFQPMVYVDHDPIIGPYDMEPVKTIIKRWTDGNDPKKLAPVVLAKFLAGKVVEHTQPTGDGLAFNRNGLLEGISLRPVGEIAQRRRATPFEMSTFLCAVYREAGLPARVVVGVTSGDAEEGNFLNRDKGDEELRAWVEFALFDEADGTLTWIPVDVLAMRKRSSRMRGNYWEKPIPFFGTHDDLDEIVPFALHFFPPTTVRSYGGSGSPAFWGWFVTPQAPERAIQSLRFEVFSTPSRGGDPRNRDR